MRKLLISCLAAVLTSACDSGAAPPTSAPGAKDTVITVFGNRQRWFTNSELPQPVTVRVHASSGEVIRGATVRLSNPSGFNSVLTTDSDGLVSTTWTLTSQPGIQWLDVQVGVRPVVANAVTADAVPLDSADIVILHGLSQGQEYALVDFDWVQRSTLRSQWPDTVKRYLPRSGLALAEELAALGEGHPPVSVIAPWTQKPDTIHVNFGPAIQIPLTLWFLNDSSFSAFQSRNDVASMSAVFGTSMMGITAGKTTIRNVSNLNLVISGCSSSLPGEVANEINVYYLRNFLSGALATVCDQRKILLSPAASGNTLAQQLGVTFTWTATSVSGNLMATTGAQLTIGQILTAHFWSFSALNAVYGLNRIGMRTCAEPNLRCFEQEYDGR